MSDGPQWKSLGPEPKQDPSPKQPNKAIVAMCHGKGLVLYIQADDYIMEDLREVYCVSNSEPWALSELGIEEGGNENGVYVCDVIFSYSKDYWTSEVNTEVDFVNFRPITTEEWEAHLRGEYPWEFKDVVKP